MFSDDCRRIAFTLNNLYFYGSTPERKAFQVLLGKIAEALQAIYETEDKGRSFEIENKAIRACFNLVLSEVYLREADKYIEKVIELRKENECEQKKL